MRREQPKGNSPLDLAVALKSGLRAESGLLLVITTLLLFIAFGKDWLANLGNPAWLAFMLLWLFGAVLVASLRVVHHAECLAVRLGEPYGTLILTLSVTFIEVAMISALMLNAGNNPTLGRDAMFAVVMIVLNGIVGLSLLLGALRYREQSYNLQGASAYLSVIIPLTVFSLVLPDVTVSTPGPTFDSFQSEFVILISISLYVTFLFIQTSRHAGYFNDVSEAAVTEANQNGDRADAPAASIAFHALLLLAYLVPVVVLAEDLAIPLEQAIAVLDLPVALGGISIAALVLAPEGMGAIRASMRNRLQRAVNIALGSVLATIGLTVPAVLAVSLYTGKEVQLGLSYAHAVLLFVTLAVSILTFSSARTNLLQGAVHLILFLIYLMLVFAP